MKQSEVLLWTYFRLLEEPLSLSEGYIYNIFSSSPGCQTHLCTLHLLIKLYIMKLNAEDLNVNNHIYIYF